VDVIQARLSDYFDNWITEHVPPSKDDNSIPPKRIGIFRYDEAELAFVRKTKPTIGSRAKINSIEE